MGYHGVNILSLNVELDILSALFVAVGAGFLLFMWPLRSVLLGVFLDYFALFRRVPGSMHQACFFIGRLISWMACVIFLVLASASLLRASWRVVFSSLPLPAMTDMVSFCPVGVFISITTFVKKFRNFYAFKTFAFILVGPSLKTPALYIGLFSPRIGDSVE